MRRLIQPDAAAARQADRCVQPPRRRVDLRAADIPVTQRLHDRVDVVAHEIENDAEHLVVGMLLRKLVVILQRMDGQLRRRQPENQPAMSGIDRFEAEDVTEKRPVRVGTLAVDEEV